MVSAEGGAPRRLTDAPAGTGDPRSAGDSNPEWSPDGRDINGLLYKPQHATPGAKLPTVLWIHGGPEGQVYTAPMAGRSIWRRQATLC